VGALGEWEQKHVVVALGVGEGFEGKELRVVKGSVVGRIGGGEMQARGDVRRNQNLGYYARDGMKGVEKMQEKEVEGECIWR